MTKKNAETVSVEGMVLIIQIMRCEMSKYVLGAVLSVVALSSCRTTRGSISDTERAVSHDGTVLFAVRTEQLGGICMFSARYYTQYHHKGAKLITERGGISPSQLKSALRYMGYKEHLASTASIVAAVAVGAAGAATIAIARPYLDDFAGYVIGAFAITGLAGGALGYRIYKGVKEGEHAEEITKRSVLDTLSLTLLAPLNEYFHRRGRLEAVVSEKQEVMFTDKKMKKVLERLAKTRPEFPGACDHLKGGLANIPQ